MGRPSAPDDDRTGPEPEIIPPERGHARASGQKSWIWLSVDPRNGPRIHIGKPGPLALFVAALLIAGFAAMAFVVLLGAALMAAPAAIVLAGTLLLSGLRRGYRLRAR